METIPKSDCQKIGFLRKTHGVQGELVLEYESQFEDSFAEADRFFLEIDGLLVPFFIAEDGLRFKSANSLLVLFDWIDNESKARRLIGNGVFLFKNEIIEEPGEGFSSQFLNYHLLDEDKRDIGTITAFDDYSGNMVLTVDTDGSELLIPYNEELVIEINTEEKFLRLQLPEGLLE